MATPDFSRWSEADHERFAKAVGPHAEYMNSIFRDALRRAEEDRRRQAFIRSLFPHDWSVESKYDMRRGTPVIDVLPASPR